MNLDELQSIRDRERQSDSLQQLRETFYEDAGELVGELRAERKEAAARADDPFDSPEVNRLSDDIKTAEQTVEAIYERRVGKLVKMASFAAADMPTEDEGLTVEERELFEHLVEAIEHNRDHVLGVLDGDGGAGSAIPGGLPGSDVEPAESAGQETSVTGAADADHQRETPPEPERPLGGADDESSAGSSGSVDAADLMAGDSGAESATDDVPAPGDSPAPDRQAGGQPPADATADEQSPHPDAPATEQSPPGTPDPSESPPDAAGDAPGPTPAETAGEGGVPVEGTDESPVPAERAGNGQVPAGSAPDADTGSAANQQESTVERGGQTGALGQDEPVTISRETVKITQEVGEIYGVDDRNYDLSTDDVVTLPAEHVDPLVERDAAERLE